jgi:hypothetical protein
VGKAEPDADGYVTIYFEGNLNGASNLEFFYARMGIAAARARDSSQTVAVARVREDELHRVAAFDPVRKVFTEISDPAALEAWSGEPIEEAVGVRLDAGIYGREPNMLIINQVTHLASDEEGYMFRTWGGQFLTAAEGGMFRIHDHDDPEMVSRLSRALARDERLLAYAIGAVQDTPSPSPSRLS